MGFKTKLDYSNNRQIKQHLETLTALSGGTSFGLPFADLTKGPNLATSGETETYSLVASTFSGNGTTTIYNWYDPRMSIGEPYLSALTPSNSADTQTVLPVFQPSATMTIDGNVVNTAFTGVTFDLYGIIMVDLGGGNYSGTVESEFFNVLSADTAEYTGRTIWVDSSGITRTQRLIITDGPQVGYVFTCTDTEGMGAWAPASTGSTPFDVYVTGGTYNNGTGIATFTNNTGGTFNVTGFSTGGGTSYWASGTGSSSIVTIFGANQSNGNYSVASGYQTKALGNVSFSEGSGTTASGNFSHAEGYDTTASGLSSHAQGSFTIAGGTSSHAEGELTIASGHVSHAEGQLTQAVGLGSHAEGVQTKALGDASHSEGSGTIASGQSSHAGGWSTNANGNFSFVHGQFSTVNGIGAIVLGRNITGSTDDTTYVDYLNIKSIPAGTPINNLGYDATGRVVQGTTGGGGGTSYWSASTGSFAIVPINSLNVASNTYAMAINSATTASGEASFAEGTFTIASGSASHAEGAYTIAGGFYASHAEGIGTRAWGEASHAEGNGCVASGTNAHAEGSSTQANGSSSHSQNVFTKANGYGSHAGGFQCIAEGDYSFVHGSGSTASGLTTFVFGRGITGTSDNTTYVDQLNIKTVGSSPSVNDIRIDATGNLTTNTSDARFKENIEPLKGALNKINSLQGVQFQWKDRIAGGNDYKLGFIAQEVEKVEPLLVFTNKNDGYKGIHIDGVIPLLVEAVKELSSGVTEYSNTYLETQTIQAEDNNIELNFNGTHESSIDGGITVLRGDKAPSTLLIDADGNWNSNVNILSKGFVIPEYTPTSSKDSSGVVGNIVQDDNYIYIKRESGWKRTPKLEDF